MLEIKSLRETIHGDYTKPPIDKLETLEAELWGITDCVGLKYLKEDRGLTDETIKHFRLGYDSVKSAIAIPVFKGNELVNIKYRYLNPTGAKYGSEKGAETWLYNDVGIEIAKKHQKILIVEGEFDLMSVWQSGIKNVVSPASGKNSYGIWIELLDQIPKVYIAYDNDKPGRDTSKEMAERIGLDKSFEVQYPEGIKDANQFFLSNPSQDEFVKIIKSARPYTSHKFKGVGDIIAGLRNSREDTVKLPFIPNVEIEKDWLMVISGRSNVGKTAYALNLAEQIANRGDPVLIMPFERGIESVGKRYLQVKFDKTIQEFKDATNSEWDKMTEECIETPVYFALPKKADIEDTIRSSKRYFNTKFVIIDHLDYVVRGTGNTEKDIANTLQSLKTVAEETGVVMLVVTHVRKLDDAGSSFKKKPTLQDLKGSSSLEQDPECVIMLDSEAEGSIDVHILKNKGEMTNQTFDFNVKTGKMKLSLFDSY